MRAIPNMTVIVPCDGIETKKAVKAITDYKGPVYMRLCRNDMEDIFPENLEFEIGKPQVLKEGTEVAVFAMGTLVSEALKAAGRLEGEGISVKVINVSTIKPLDESSVIDMVKGMRGVITAEEHTCIGGLASAITYALRKLPVPIDAVAIEDIFGQSAESHKELLENYGLTDAVIAQKVRSILDS